MRVRVFAPALVLILLVACKPSASAPTEAGEEPMPLSITSSAFEAGGTIPARHSCNAEGISPALSWSGAPAGVRTFALIMDDPDAPAGTYVHWVMYNIPASSGGLPEAVAAADKLADGSIQGPNSSGRRGYSPPCPPSGTHRYFFKLYALDTTVGAVGAGKAELLQAMEGHVLGQGELMGTFAR
jgi:Raf kinase inhibitor-like YbhB/YbcL family protein